jgi:hypothetical protein
MMASDTTVFIAVLLLFLGGTSLVLSFVVGRFSTKGGVGRPFALLAVGLVSLFAMVYLLWGMAWGEAWDAVFYPLLHLCTAATVGLALGAFIVYLLVAAR